MYINFILTINLININYIFIFTLNNQLREKINNTYFFSQLSFNIDIATGDTKQKAAQKNQNLMVANLYKMQPENIHINANLIYLNH